MSSRKTWLIALITITIVTWLVALFLFISRYSSSTVAQAQQLPTLMVFPSATPTGTATIVPTATNTALPTQTTRPTNIPLPTVTLLPTLTPTLSVRLLEVTAVMPGVYVEPTGTPFPFGTNLVPAPANERWCFICRIWQWLNRIGWCG
ncbi:MAG: hypothetical protein AAFV93_11100, partial [Chloroflexota bacterium]